MTFRRTLGRAPKLFPVIADLLAPEELEGVGSNPRFAGFPLVSWTDPEILSCDSISLITYLTM